MTQRKRKAGRKQVQRDTIDCRRCGTSDLAHKVELCADGTVAFCPRCNVMWVRTDKGRDREFRGFDKERPQTVGVQEGLAL